LSNVLIFSILLNNFKKLRII